jgi:MoxR-like ATPase
MGFDRRGWDRYINMFNAKMMYSNIPPHKLFLSGRRGLHSIRRSEKMRDDNSLIKFTGASKYVLDEELAKIVNISMALEMPLLLKGEPGTGKTMLAYAIAEALDMPLIVLNVKSSMKLVDALYLYDTLTRLNDSRFGDSKRDVSNIEDYIRMGKIGQSFVSDIRVVLLIDEIDKADTDFQDDMLDVLDQMSFDIIEIDKTIKARNRPVVVITSNAKKDLSDPFLGRCNFHHIAFPDADMMRTIVSVHFPEISRDLMENAVKTFYRLRDIRGVEKKPATRELINWIRALKADPDFKVKDLTKGEVPYLGVLFKKSPDYTVAQGAVSRFRL